MRSPHALIARLSSKSSKKNSSQAETPAQPGTRADLVRIGEIGASHGLRGNLKFRPDDPGTTLIDELERVFIDTGGEPAEFRLIGVSPVNPRQMRIALEGISDIDAAAALRGAVVFAAKSDLPPTADGEFYYYQTAGCEVFTTDGRVVGHIKSTFFSGAH